MELNLKPIDINIPIESFDIDDIKFNHYKFD